MNVFHRWCVKHAAEIVVGAMLGGAMLAIAQLIFGR